MTLCQAALIISQLQAWQKWKQTIDSQRSTKSGAERQQMFWFDLQFYGNSKTWCSWVNSRKFTTSGVSLREWASCPFTLGFSSFADCRMDIAWILNGHCCPRFHSLHDPSGGIWCLHCSWFVYEGNITSWRCSILSSGLLFNPYALIVGQIGNCRGSGRHLGNWRKSFKRPIVLDCIGTTEGSEKMWKEVTSHALPWIDPWCHCRRPTCRCPTIVVGGYQQKQSCKWGGMGPVFTRSQSCMMHCKNL